MKYQELWPAIQQDILGVLQADDFLGTRKGLAVEPGDAESVINQKIATAMGPGLDGRNGVGFLVLPIERAEDDNANLPGGPLKLTISLQWVENVLLNQSQAGTGIPIRVYAAWTEKLLKLYTPVGLTQSLIPAHPVISEFTDNTNKNLRVGRVDFTRHGSRLPPLRPREPAPDLCGRERLSSAPNSYQLIGSNVTLVSIAAPDADAGQIYYTTDNSHPTKAMPPPKSTPAQSRWPNPAC